MMPWFKLTLRSEELNEEDQQLKTELEMLVSRLQVTQTSELYKAALKLIITNE